MAMHKPTDKRHIWAFIFVLVAPIAPWSPRPSSVTLCYCTVDPRRSSVTLCYCTVDPRCSNVKICYCAVEFSTHTVTFNQSNPVSQGWCSLRKLPTLAHIQSIRTGKHALPILPPKIHLVAVTQSLLLRLLILAMMSAVIDLVENKIV